MKKILILLLSLFLSGNLYASSPSIESAGGNGDMSKATYDTDNNGTVDTATALAANGSNCSSGNAPLGVDASGASESCFDVATQAELDATVSDTIYGSGWNGDTTHAPSKNAVYDKIETISSGGEVNTASNLGGGLANYSTKVGVDLQFNSFTVADFNLASNLISIDYTNGQAAASGTKGFLTGTDWDTFNNKQSTITWGAGLANTGATGRTDSTEADFLASGALTCGASTQGKMKVHTTALQYCDNAATPALQYAAYGSSTGVATSATILATTRAIYGNNFDGSAALAQVIASTYGGTGNGFTKFSGPGTSEKTFTLPNASATVLTDNAVVTVAQGGTGAGTLTGLVKGNGTSAMTAVTAPSGAVVGDTDTQTLTNKTLTSPTINTPTVDSQTTNTYLIIPTGTNPTVATAGKIAEDTTQTQLLLGATPNVFSPTHQACVTITSLTAADDNVQFFVADRDIHVTSTMCRYSGTGSTVGTFTLADDKTATGMTITGTNPTCVKGNNTASAAAVTANNAITSGNGVQFSVSNTPNPTTDNYTLCIDYTEDRK